MTRLQLLYSCYCFVTLWPSTANSALQMLTTLPFYSSVITTSSRSRSIIITGPNIRWFAIMNRWVCRIGIRVSINDLVWWQVVRFSSNRVFILIRIGSDGLRVWHSIAAIVFQNTFRLSRCPNWIPFLVILREKSLIPHIVSWLWGRLARQAIVTLYFVRLSWNATHAFRLRL